MTLQVNSCSEIVFNTTEIYNIPAESVTELSIQYSKNCGESTTVDLSASIDDIYSPTNDAETGTNFTLTPQQLYESDDEKFCEGVYYFKWIITVGADQYTYSICVLLDCENKIKCKVSEYYLDTEDMIPILLYDAVLLQNDCDVCTCTEACKIYKQLSNLLNLNNVSTDGCGCS